MLFFIERLLKSSLCKLIIEPESQILLKTALETLMKKKTLFTQYVAIKKKTLGTVTSLTGEDKPTR